MDDQDRWKSVRPCLSLPEEVIILTAFFGATKHVTARRMAPAPELYTIGQVTEEEGIVYYVIPKKMNGCSVGCLQHYCHTDKLH